MMCPNCGNDDPERMLTQTEPILMDGRITGFVLRGFECACCGYAFQQAIAEPTDASAERSG